MGDHPIVNHCTIDAAKQSELKQKIETSGNGRLVMFIRHGSKIEMANRLDLPIEAIETSYCKDAFESFCEIAPLIPDPIIFASPFLRTKQTAGRLAYMIGYTDPIYLINGLGETYSEVSKYLKQCDDIHYYRIPIHPDEPCVSKLSKEDQAIYLAGQTEVKQYNFDDSLNEPLPDFNSSSMQDNYYTYTINRLLNKFPTKNIIFITHAGLVRRSLQIMKPRSYFPRTAAPVIKTCASTLFKESKPKSGQYNIVHVNFAYI